MTTTQKQIISDMLNNRNILRSFMYLRDRWEDEKAYEDFNDYVSAMAKHLPESLMATDIKGTKRPFGLKFKCGDTYVHFFLNIKNGYCNLKVGLTR